MNEEIKLLSRYGDTYILTKVDDKKYEFAPEWCRVGIIEGNPNQYSFIDPSGGPFIEVGSSIKGNRVKAIHNEQHGVIIEFE